MGDAEGDGTDFSGLEKLDFKSGFESPGSKSSRGSSRSAKNKSLYIMNNGFGPQSIKGQ